MNYNRRVLQLVLIFTLVLLIASLLEYPFAWNWLPLNRVNVIADIIKKPPAIAHDSSARLYEEQRIIVKENAKKTELALYHRGKLITDFNADTTQPSLSMLEAKLHALKKSGKGKIRIAYFGDSMIEADLISGTLRKLLQQYFGGSGIGFVPIASPVAGFRTTIAHSFSGWEEKNFKTESNGNNHLYISGHTFFSGNGSVSMNDKTITDSAALIEKSLICGPGKTSITVNDTLHSIETPELVNRVIVEKSTSHSLKLKISNSSLSMYGISFESASGVFVDNFSFRGISGVEFARIDSALLTSITVNNAYDFIILQYGVNLLFRPNDKNYTWYGKIMKPSLTRLQNSFSNSNFLLVSAGDRAFRYGNEYKTAVGIDSLIMVQANLAYNSGCAFYNLYQSMGGEGTIVAWANENPSLANKDYVHPNFRGAEILGRNLYDAIMNDYNKYTLANK